MRNLTLIFSLFFLGTVYAQESLNTTGGDATSNDGSVSYSIGQIFYQTNESSTGTIEEGVQHAYEIYYLSVENPIIDIEMNVFPNPTSDIINLHINGLIQNELSYSLYDIQGKMIKNEKINSSNSEINMEGLATSTYFLNVVYKNQNIKSFKIIKK